MSPKDICEKIITDGNCDFIADCQECPLDRDCSPFQDMELILARLWLDRQSTNNKKGS